MKSQINIDFENMSIVVNSGFAKKAKACGSKEFKKLSQVRKDFPDFEVEVRTINQKQGIERYKGLNYDRMEFYINKYCPEKMDAFQEQLELAKGHSRRYGVIRSWFFEACPEFLQYGVEDLHAKVATVTTQELPTAV